MNNQQFNLLTTLNLNCNDQRWSDFMFCLNKNLQNQLINFIYIAIELDENNQDHLIKYNHISSFNERVVVHKIIKRPTFTELFTFCNKIKGLWIISNADIYFPKTNVDNLSLILKRNYNKECFVLTRYNILDEMKEKRRGIDLVHDGLNLRTQMVAGGSVDSWIFETPFDLSEVNFDIQLGQPGCDGMMSHQLSKIRKLYNPCLSIISIHKHLGWYTWYAKVNFNGQLITRSEYVKLMKKKGIGFKNVQFCELKGASKLD